MPHTEKLKLKEESRGVERAVESPVKTDHKILVKLIHEAYVKNFNMNKAKARLILTGKTNKPVHPPRFVSLYGSILCSRLFRLHPQPFVIHDMETFQLAERTLAVHMVTFECPDPAGDLQSGRVSPALEGEELQQREAEARLFHCCQSTSVETVTELTEFAKAVPGFQSLDLNDQVGKVFPERD